jgi:phosphonate transport system substrate-binding protein
MAGYPKHLCAGLVALFCVYAGPASAADPPVKIAITPVLVEHYLEVNKEWIAYIGERIGRPTELVQRKSYQEISELLAQGKVDVGFVCGAPYVIDHVQFGEELLVGPQVYPEGPIYFSYVIVPSDSPITRFEDLRGRRYAFSDPLSNSGKLVPTYMLAKMGETPESFFQKYIFTYSHSANVEAVAEHFVDGASVDSYVYDYLAQTNPELTAKTRIISKSPPHGITPVVVRKDLSPALKDSLRRAFLGMDQDPRGQAILKKMGLIRFVVVHDREYDSIRAMKQYVDGVAAVAEFNKRSKR